MSRTSDMLSDDIAALLAANPEETMARYHLVRALNAACKMEEPPTSRPRKRPPCVRHTYVLTCPGGAEVRHADTRDHLRWAVVSRHRTPTDEEMAQLMAERRVTYARMFPSAVKEFGDMDAERYRDLIRLHVTGDWTVRHVTHVPKHDRRLKARVTVAGRPDWHGLLETAVVEMHLQETDND